MKLKFYFYFQLTEHFFRKRRNHLAETNSWSSPQGTKQQDSSGLQSSWKLWVKGPAVTETAALTEATSWHKPWGSAPHTATCQRSRIGTLWWRRSSSSAEAETNTWKRVPAAVLQAQSSSFYLCLSLSAHDSTRQGEEWGQLHTATAHRCPSTAPTETLRAGGSSIAHSHPTEIKLVLPPGMAGKWRLEFLNLSCD